MDEGVILVPLTRGKTAIIDREDGAIVLGYSWQAIPSKWTFYARRGDIQADGRQKTIPMHRAIMNAPDGMEVDHIDGDGLNNRRSNLRICTPAQNKANHRMRETNKSGYRGVLLEPDGRTWRACFAWNYLGTFDTPEEAARAYDTASRARYGEFAALNFPDDFIPVPPRAGRIHVARNNTSGHTGITMTKKNGRWSARITVEGKRIHLGYFPTIEEALAAQRRRTKASDADEMVREMTT